jgi:hypothetical protein
VEILLACLDLMLHDRQEHVHQQAAAQLDSEVGQP